MLLEACPAHLPADIVLEDLEILQARGPVLFQIRRFLLERHGEEAWQRLLAQVSQPCREAFGRSLGCWEWVDAAHSWELSQAFAREMGADFYRERGYDSAREHLGSLSAWFMRLASPQFLVLNLPNLWRFYYKGGLLTLDEQGDREAHISIWARGGYPEMFSMTLPAWGVQALEMAGCEGPKVFYEAPKPLYSWETGSTELQMEACRHRYHLVW